MKTIFFSALVVFTVFLFSCKKESHKEEIKQEITIQNKDLILKYLSITLGVEIERIEIDYNKSVFYVTGTQYSSPIDSVVARYNRANEYKLKYEK